MFKINLGNFFKLQIGQPKKRPTSTKGYQPVIVEPQQGLRIDRTLLDKVRDIRQYNDKYIVFDPQEVVDKAKQRGREIIQQFPRAYYAEELGVMCQVDKYEWNQQERHSRQAQRIKEQFPLDSRYQS